MYNERIYKEVVDFTQKCQGLQCFLIDRYGKFGPYQIVQTAIVLFNIWPTGFQLLIGVFIGMI
jgi:hypothetical protein